MFADRAKMTTATTGTGAITLGSASAGFQTFAAAGVTDGATVRYVIEDGTAWEIGTGTYTAAGTSLSRSIEQSSTGALLNLTGAAVAYVTAAAADLAALLNRANHTGTQLAATISDFSTAAKTAVAPIATTLNYDGTWQAYAIPANAKELLITCIGPGGNGGSGYSRAAGNAGGGGGGGGAGGITTVRVSVARLGVSTIYAFPGQSSGGNLSYVSIAADTTSQNLLCRASGGANATNGSATLAGGAGAAGAISTFASTGLACLGMASFVAGQVGASGGSNTGAGGASCTWDNTGVIVSGGGGGAGSAGTDYTGGRITGLGAVVTNLNGGAAGGGAGSAGVTYASYGFYTGGSGGGSNDAGTGGAGGAGAIGSGGGGGGAGVTGGNGGAGGNGLVMIEAIF